jgi:hypothetical protein
MSPEDDSTQTSTQAFGTSFRKNVARLAMAAAAALGISACSAESLTAPSAPELARKSLPASVQPTSDVDPISPPEDEDQALDLILPFLMNPVMNPCRPGEIIVLQGGTKGHFEISTSSGGNLHVGAHYVTTATTGTATTVNGTTVKYVNSGTGEFTWNIPGPFPVEHTHTVRTHLIRQGTDELDKTTDVGDDFIYSETVHLTINANGLVTVIVAKVEPDCR